MFFLKADDGLDASSISEAIIKNEYEIFLLIFLTFFTFISLFIIHLYYLKNKDLKKIATLIFTISFGLTSIIWATNFFIHIHLIHTIIIRVFIITSFLSFFFLLNELVNYYIWYKIFTKDGFSLVPTFLKNVVTFFIYSTGIILTVMLFHGKTHLLFLISGATAFIIAYSSQKIISDIFSALAFNITPSFRKGDTIQYDNQWFNVEDINWRFVTLIDNNNNRYCVPNSLLSSNSILNYSLKDKKAALEVEFKTGIQVPPQIVIDLISNELKQLSRYDHEEEIQLYVLKICDYINFQINFPVKYIRNSQEIFEILSDITKITWYTLHKNNIPIYIQPLELHQYKKNEIEPKIPDPKTIDKIFKYIILFKDFNKQNLNHLIQKSKIRYFVPPQKIIFCGQNDKTLHVIIKGKASVYLHQGDGNSIKTSTLSQGDIFGIMSLLTGQERRVDIVADTSVITYEINYDIIKEILKKHPEYIEKIVNRINKIKMEDDQKTKQYEKNKKKQKQENEKLKHSLIGHIQQYFDI